jgi:hypothetical protein
MQALAAREEALRRTNEVLDSRIVASSPPRSNPRSSRYGGEGDDDVSVSTALRVSALADALGAAAAGSDSSPPGSSASSPPPASAHAPVAPARSSPPLGASMTSRPAAFASRIPAPPTASGAAAAAAPPPRFTTAASSALPPAAPAPVAPASSRTRVDATDDIDERLPAETQVRLLRGALKLARGEASSAAAAAATAAAALQDLSRAAAAAAEERARLIRAAAASEGALARAKTAASRAEAREADARAAIEDLRRSALTASAAANNNHKSENVGDAAKLARALDENEKLRASLASERAAAAEASALHKRESEAALVSTRKLEKQRTGENAFHLSRRTRCTRVPCSCRASHPHLNPPDHLPPRKNYIRLSANK